MPSLQPLSSSNREVGRLSPHVLTASSRIKPCKYIIFLVDVTRSSGRDKATSFHSNCSPLQDDVTTEDWLQFYWAGVFFEGKKYTEARKMEKGSALSLLSFLRTVSLVKIDLPPGFPVLQEALPTQESEWQGNGAAAAIRVDLYPDAWVKYSA